MCDAGLAVPAVEAETRPAGAATKKEKDKDKDKEKDDKEKTEADWVRVKGLDNLKIPETPANAAAASGWTIKVLTRIGNLDKTETNFVY